MGISRAFVYGDLLIETIAVVNGKMRFGQLHFERITNSARLLNIQLPENWGLDYLIQVVAAQCKLDRCRARLVISRMGTGFYLPNSNEAQFNVEYWPLPIPKLAIEKIGVYRENKKACSPLSNLKTGNALLYVLASQYAQLRNLDDVLLLNTNNNITEASSSNVFWIKNGIIYTPPLTEGPVNGVMRRALIVNTGYAVIEQQLSEETLSDADECFLTNAIHGIVSIKSFESSTYSTTITDSLRKNLLNE